MSEEDTEIVDDNNLPAQSTTNNMVVVNGKEMPIEVKEDFDKARDNLIQMLREGNENIVKLSEIAKDTEHPRVFEVLSGMMNTLGNLNKQLIELNKDKMKLLDGLKDASEQPKGGDTNINNAIFVGSTKDLQDYFNNKDKENDK